MSQPEDFGKVNPKDRFSSIKFSLYNSALPDKDRKFIDLLREPYGETPSPSTPPIDWSELLTTLRFDYPIVEGRPTGPFQGDFSPISPSFLFGLPTSAGLEDSVGPDDKPAYASLSPLEQMRVFVATAKLATYIQEQGIVNLLLLDRAARPAHLALRAYWDAFNQGKKPPYHVNFLNPRGFISAERADTDSAVVTEMLKSILSVDFVDSETPRPMEDIVADLQGERFRRLLRRREQPTLLFDNCIHTGDSMKRVQDVLLRVGFTDVRVGVGSTYESTSVLVPDFVALPDAGAATCSLFGTERLVEKPFGSVTSQPVRKNAARRISAASRRAVKRAAVELPVFDLPSSIRSSGTVFGELNGKDLGEANSPFQRRIASSLAPVSFQEAIFSPPEISLSELEKSADRGNCTSVRDVYRTLLAHNLQTPTDAVEAVRSGSLSRDQLVSIIDAGDHRYAVFPALIHEAKMALKKSGEE